MRPTISPTRLERLVDADPDLAARLPSAERERATDVLVVPVLHISSGPAVLAHDLPDGLFALLVLHGVLSVQSRLRGRLHLELLGDGEVLQPWVGIVERQGLLEGLDWWAHEPTEVAVLTEALVARTCRWPQILTALTTRLLERQRRMLFQSALRSLVSVDERLLLMLWHLAERFGHVTPCGVRVDVPLTHEQFGALIGVRRPSATTGFARLRNAGVLELVGPHRYLLHGESPAELATLSPPLEASGVAH